MLGPSDGSPCPSWVVNDAELGTCPVQPTCEEQSQCSGCAAMDDCAWCASQNSCMTVSEVFAKDCRGTVFDVPCPESFVGVNRVVGNLIVESDSVFGGGHFKVTGNVTATQTFGLSIDQKGYQLNSADFVEISGGNNHSVNSPGGNVTIKAGLGKSVNRGRGGSVAIHAGSGQGLIEGGGPGNGGHVVVNAGSSIDGDGGTVVLDAGISTNGNGGDVELKALGKNGNINVIAVGGVRLHASTTNSGGFLELIGGERTFESPTPSYPKIVGRGITGSVHLKAGDQDGNQTTGAGGAVFLASSGAGGAVYIQGGSSANSESSGEVSVFTGNANAISGPLLMGTGLSNSTSSGNVKISTGHGAKMSGALLITSGNALAESSGEVMISTGRSQNGSSGNITIASGGSEYRNGGGFINIKGGNYTMGGNGKAGGVIIEGGTVARSPMSSGGDVVLIGGHSSNANLTNASSGTGGSIQIVGGKSDQGDGGDVNLKSGAGAVRSGDVAIGTAEAMNIASNASSGDVRLFSGNAVSGSQNTPRVTGDIHLETGSVGIWRGRLSRARRS